MIAFTSTPFLPFTQCHRAGRCALAQPMRLARRAPGRCHTTTFAYHIHAALSSETSGLEADPQLEAISERDRSRIESVRDQLEFWFSASNLRRDWYLRRQMDDQGWLDPAVFLLFNRIKRLNASLGDIILASRMSDELQVSLPSSASFGDDAAQTRVRRSPTLPDFREWDDSELRRSFMLKSIPHDSTVDSLIEAFGEMGAVSYVHVYRGKVEGMAPRALVCFEEEVVADRVFADIATRAPAAICGMIVRRRHLAPGTQGAEVSASHSASMRTYPGVMMVVHVTGLPVTADWKFLFRQLDDAVVLRSARHIRFMLHTQGTTECYLTLADVASVRDMVAYFAENGLMVANSKVQVRLLEDEDELKDYWEKANAHQEERRRKRAERASADGGGQGTGVVKRPSGVVFKIEGFAEGVTWQTIKSELLPHGKIVFLNYERGSRECYVRVSSHEEATIFCEQLGGPDGVKIAGDGVTARILEGEEEEQYWDRAEQRQKMKRAKLQDVTSEPESAGDSNAAASLAKDEVSDVVAVAEND